MKYDTYDETIKDNSYYNHNTKKIEVNFQLLLDRMEYCYEIGHIQEGNQIYKYLKKRGY